MLTLLLLTLACRSSEKDPSGEAADSGRGDSGADDSGAGDSAPDSGTDSASDSGTDSGTTDVCGEEPSCALEVDNPTAECGSNSSGDPTYVMAAEMRPGEIQITVVNAVGGCCPDGVVVSAEITPETNVIDVSWVLGEDPCQCFCMLDVGATLPEVPAGTWVVRAGGYEASVVSQGPK